MYIREIDTTNQDDIHLFLELPFKIYRDNNYWVSPLANDMRVLLDRDYHPVFQHSGATSGKQFST